MDISILLFHIYGLNKIVDLDGSQSRRVTKFVDCSGPGLSPLIPSEEAIIPGEMSILKLEFNLTEKYCGLAGPAKYVEIPENMGEIQCSR